MILVIESNREAVAVGRLTGGDGGVAQTVAAIQALIDDATFGTDASRFRAIAENMPATSVGAFARALWAWCRTHVRFHKDPDGVEYVRHPSTMLDAIDANGYALGDCDDLATLAATIIAARGLRPVLVTVGRRRRGRFEHIFFGLRLDAERLDRETVLPLDPQENNAPGQWPRNTPRVQLWSVSPSPLHASR